MGAGQSVGAVESFAAMQRLTDLAVEVTAAEMKAAAFGVARAVQESYPEATHVLLEQSDQGDWLELTGWCHGDEGDVQEFTKPWEDEDLLSAPSHLYTCHIGSSVEQSAVPGLWCTDRRSGRYVLEVATVLAMVEPQEPVLEVLTVRDPDGPTHVEALVLGRSVSTVEVSVDAGAGWAWADWCAHREASLARVSEAFRPTVLEAFTDPPGGRYVCGRGEDPWVPQDAGGEHHWWIFIERERSADLAVGPYPTRVQAQTACEVSLLVDGLCEEDCLDIEVRWCASMPSDPYEVVIVDLVNPHHSGRDLAR